MSEPADVEQDDDVAPWMEWVALVTDFGMLWVLAVPLVAGFIAGLVSDAGRTTDAELFSAIAQLAPVLMLAALVEEALGFQRVWEEDEDDKADPVNRAASRGVMRAILARHFGLFVMAEAACLYVLGGKPASTFVTAVAVSAPLVHLAVIGRAHVDRYRP